MGPPAKLDRIPECSLNLPSAQYITRMTYKLRKVLYQTQAPIMNTHQDQLNKEQGKVKSERVLGPEPPQGFPEDSVPITFWHNNLFSIQTALPSLG